MIYLISILFLFVGGAAAFGLWCILSDDDWLL
jgi:hypothetical protein